METSWPRLNGEKARMESSEFDRKDGLCLEFYYHMYGSHVNTLNVYLNNTHQSKLIWSLKKEQGDSWKKAQVPLNLSTPKYKVSYELQQQQLTQQQRYAFTTAITTTKAPRTIPQ